MKIAVDAMGGDHAPGAVVEGAVLAARAHDLEVVLVGRQSLIRAELARAGGMSARVRIRHAGDVVAMDEPHPAQAIRRKPDASLRACFDLLRAGEVDAVVSAGNSGAVMAGALLFLGRLEGVDRPAVATALPTRQGRRCVLIDAGANTECEPVHLAQWGLCAEAYARAILGIEAPRIAVLSNGEEATKGTELTRRAAELLAGSEANFVGYVEGRGVFEGAADVVVTDGFTGNVLLKTAEGVALALYAMMREEIEASAAARAGYLLMRGALKRFQRRLDYAEYGGAPLLGTRGVTILAHGASNAIAIKNAVRVARDLARAGLDGVLVEAARKATALAEAAGAREEAS